MIFHLVLPPALALLAGVELLAMIGHPGLTIAGLLLVLVLVMMTGGGASINHFAIACSSVILMNISCPAGKISDASAI